MPVQLILLTLLLHQQVPVKAEHVAVPDVLVAWILDIVQMVHAVPRMTQPFPKSSTRRRRKVSDSASSSISRILCPRVCTPTTPARSCALPPPPCRRESSSRFCNLRRFSALTAVDTEGRAQALKRGSQGLRKRAFSVDAMNNVERCHQNGPISAGAPVNQDNTQRLPL